METLEKVKVLKTEDQYDAALKRLMEIFDAQPGSEDFDEAELLGVLISDYEDKHHPIEMPDYREVIRLKMEEKGLKQKDLESILGSKSYVSAILSGKRNMTLKAAQALHRVLGVPIQSFFLK